MSEESRVEPRNASRRPRVNGRNVRHTLDVSPGVSLYVVEPSVVNVLTYQLYGRLVVVFVHLWGEIPEQT